MKYRAAQRVVTTAISALLCAAGGTAQVQTPADTTVRLVLELDRPDWSYHVRDSATFRVRLLRSGLAVPGASVRLAIGIERTGTPSVHTVRTGSGGWSSVRATLDEPGFLRATATTTLNGVDYTAVATAAFDPDRVQPSVDMPADFLPFWNSAVAAARAVPLDAVLTPMPARSTADVEVFHVSFQNQRVGSRIYGILSMPRRPGRYPAMLVVPGAGVRPYFPSIETARRGVIHLAIGIHGIPVDRDSLLYNELRATALQSYNTAGVEDRERYYYKRVFVGVVRAGDFLFSLPQFDGRNYAVQGGSQGGGLALVAAALDPRVRAIAVSYPALADHLAYLHGRPGGWPHILADTAAVKAKAEKIETLRYYDAVNFARLVQVPGIYAWGFNDPTVPPRSMYAAYNQITAPRQLLVHPPAGHNRTPAQIRQMDEWLLEQLGVSGR